MEIVGLSLEIEIASEREGRKETSVQVKSVRFIFIGRGGCCVGERKEGYRKRKGNTMSWDLGRAGNHAARDHPPKLTILVK